MGSVNTHLNLLHHLFRPARGGAAAVVVVFAFLLVMAANMKLAGIPVALLVTSWFFKYAYILFDHTVRGFDEPPTLDIQMMNPIDEQRPLAQVVILGLLGYAVYLTYDHFGVPEAVGLGGVCLFFLSRLGRHSRSGEQHTESCISCVLVQFSARSGNLVWRGAAVDRGIRFGFEAVVVFRPVAAR